MSWLSSALRATGLNKPLDFAAKAVYQPVRGIGRIARGKFEEGFGDVLSGGSKLATMYGLGSAGMGIGKALTGALGGGGGASAGAAASALPTTSASSLASSASYTPSVVSAGAPSVPAVIGRQVGGGMGSGIGRALAGAGDVAKGAAGRVTGAVGDVARSVGGMSTTDKLLMGSTLANTVGAILPEPGAAAQERYMDAQTRSLLSRTEFEEEERERQRRREERMAPFVQEIFQGLMNDYRGSQR